MKKFATLLTISTTAHGLAFDGPLPTPVQDLLYTALDGYSPRPTSEARSLPDLFRRQKADSAICGYLDGDANFPLSCTAGPCTFNPASKWFGCSSAQVITRCVNSASYAKCLEDSACYNDAAAMACTASLAPNCVNVYAKVQEGTMSHWVCGASATSIGVMASSKGSSTKSEGASASGSAKPASVVKSARASSAPADASVIRQGNLPTGGAAGPVLNGASATAQVQVQSVSPSSAKSTGGAAVHTAGALVGAVGGMFGVFAVLL